MDLLAESVARDMPLNHEDKLKIASRTAALARHFATDPAAADFVESQLDTVYRSLDIPAHPREMMNAVVGDGTLVCAPMNNNSSNTVCCTR